MTDTPGLAPSSELPAAGTALLTTFRRSGREVATPVSIAVDAGHVYFVTAADSGKAKRLASNDTVTLAPCTTGGTVTGPTARGRARPLDGIDRRRRRRLLRPTRQLFWSHLLFRMQRKTMRLYEVTLLPDSR